MIVKLKTPAGIAAAIVSGEYQVRNILSTKCWIDQALVLRISGMAMRNNSRYPPGEFHLWRIAVTIDIIYLPLVSRIWHSDNEIRCGKYY